jgi:hypothetical protein
MPDLDNNIISPMSIDRGDSIKFSATKRYRALQNLDADKKGCLPEKSSIYKDYDMVNTKFLGTGMQGTVYKVYAKDDLNRELPYAVKCLRTDAVGEEVGIEL